MKSCWRDGEGFGQTYIDADGLPGGVEVHVGFGDHDGGEAVA